MTIYEYKIPVPCLDGQTRVKSLITAHDIDKAIDTAEWCMRQDGHIPLEIPTEGVVVNFFTETET